MRQITKLTLIILFIGLFFNSSVFAQTSYSSTKVDELSDTQIVDLMKKAEAAGYSDAQLEQMASAQGMKTEEIQKLRMRVDKIRKQGAAVAIENKTTNTGREGSETVVANANNDKKVKDSEIASKIYGADLFNNGNIVFEPNLRIATPKNYVIGPDDRLSIELNGDNEVPYDRAVTAEGIVTLPFVGRINVNGLTIEQATAKIKAAMSQTYPALKTGRTKLTVSLGNIRSIKVTITGQVTKTGTYTLSSLSTVYNALYLSGGPSQNGTYRNIQVIRNNKVIGVVDVYNFKLKGIKQGDIRLEDQDVINIPVYEKRVEMTGEVKQAALFEVIKGETLKDVINFAGGYTVQAYQAKIRSFQNTDKERKLVDISASEFDAYVPKNGDKYIVEPILDRFENRVEISGAVFRPGAYELEKGLTLKNLILKADGLTEDAFMFRGYINRLNADNSQNFVPFDVGKIMSGTTPDIVLQREDKVTISSIFDLRDEYKVTIQGEVRVPGTFAYADNLTLESIIQLAGGFKEGATPNRIDISRRVKNTSAGAAAQTAEIFTVNVDRDLKIQGEPFVLKPFDIISVRNTEGYEVQKQITFEGEVLFPGNYTITKKNERISDVIKRAGGLTPLAFVDGASLLRPARNNAEEQQKTMLNIKRLQESGTKSDSAFMPTSDLVGINMQKILNNPGSNYDLIVEDGDVIRIPRQLQTVKVSGEVLNPNNIIYLPGKNFKQYLNSAGGLTFNAYRRGIHIKYANGSVEAAKKFLFFNNYPIVKPGAEIIIPPRAQREKLNAQAWLGIGTGIASLAAIIVSLLR